MEINLHLDPDVLFTGMNTREIVELIRRPLDKAFKQHTAVPVNLIKHVFENQRLYRRNSS